MNPSATLDVTSTKSTASAFAHRRVSAFVIFSQA
jgi:hypothetical protein